MNKDLLGLVGEDSPELVGENSLGLVGDDSPQFKEDIAVWFS